MAWGVHTPSRKATWKGAVLPGGSVQVVKDEGGGGKAPEDCGQQPLRGETELGLLYCLAPHVKWSFLCPHCVREEAMHVSPSSQVELPQDHIKGSGPAPGLDPNVKRGGSWLYVLCVLELQWGPNSMPLSLMERMGNAKVCLSF